MEILLAGNNKGYHSFGIIIKKYLSSDLLFLIQEAYKEK